MSITRFLMVRWSRTTMAVGLLFVLAACAPLSRQPLAALGIDGLACTGQIITPPAGLVEQMDPALLASALGAAEQGKLCAARVLLVQQPVQVYRVWEQAKPWTALGGWWSFDPPAGPRDAYREKNAICKAWSALDRVSTCTLKVGSRIVVGTGQSAKCDDGVYPPSAVNQVYMANDSRAGQLMVEGCTPGVAWP
jgi:hypothetical protein